MAYCSNCGHQISDQAVNCPSCGHPRQGAVPGALAYQQPGARPYPGATIGLPQYGVNSLADPGQRLLARLIDAALIGIIAVVLVIVGAFTAVGVDNASNGAGGAFVVLLVLLAIGGTFFYEVGMVATRGQTLGKMAMGIKVVDSRNGEIPGWGPSAIRWVITIVAGFVPFGSILDSLWLLWDPNRQCLHDKPANTLVVRVR